MKLEPNKIYYLREKIEMYREEEDHVMERLMWVNKVVKEEESGKLYAEGMTYSFKRDLDGNILDYIPGNSYTEADTEGERLYECEEVKVLSLDEFREIKDKLIEEWQDMELELSKRKGLRR